MKLLRLGVMLTALLSVTCAAFAAERPDAGTILRSQWETKKQDLKKEELRIEISDKQSTGYEQTGQRIEINDIRITGQTIIGETELRRCVSDLMGKEFSFNQLEEITARITQYFRSQGYLVATAYIPAQEIKDSILEITVVVGQYGEITIRNQSLLKNEVVTHLLGNLHTGDYIKKDPLERSLLLLNDIGGVIAQTTIIPGKVPGTSNLHIEINDSARINGQIYADNFGNRFTGQNRAGLSINVNNATGIGDVLLIGGVYAGSGMNNYNVSYSLPFGGQGLKLGAGYSRMGYTLGKDFAILDATGTANSASVFGSYPIIRSRGHNLTGHVQYDSKKIEDKMGTLNSVANKKAGVWSIGVSGNYRDNSGNAVTSYSLSHYTGKLTINSLDDKVVDMLTAQTAGSFTKTTLNISRMQVMDDRLTGYIFFNGQYADKNLDSSEKLQIGGPNSVRAYPVGEAASDQGYILTMECRWSLPTPTLQLVAFIDAGKATLNKNPWENSGPNRRTLSGTGLGVIWNNKMNTSVRLDYARKLGSGTATADTDKNGRFWLQGVQYF